MGNSSCVVQCSAVQWVAQFPSLCVFCVGVCEENTKKKEKKVGINGAYPRLGAFCVIPVIFFFLSVES